MLVPVSSLTLMLSFKFTRPEPSTTGRKFRPTPNSLNSTVMPSNPCGTGIGNSPPERNRASWPDSVVSVGSARIFARPFSLAASSVRLKRPLPVSRLAKKPVSSIDIGFGMNSSMTGPNGAFSVKIGMRKSPGANTASGNVAPPFTAPTFQRLPPTSMPLNCIEYLRSSLRAISATLTSSMTCWAPATCIRLMTWPPVRSCVLACCCSNACSSTAVPTCARYPRRAAARHP